MEQKIESGNGYGKRPLWQLVIIYLTLAAIVYGLVYYFVLSKGGGYNPTSQTYPLTTQNAPQPTRPSNATVSIKNFSFNPQTMIIKTGTKVVWVNDDSASHTVTSDSGTFLNSSTISPGQSFSLTFNNPGSVNYHCNIHPLMKGTIVVVD